MPTSRPTHRPVHAPTVAQTRARNLDKSKRYDNTWKKFRALYLHSNPLCKDCLAEGILTAATDVHHIIRVTERPDLRLSEDAVEGLCHSCHSKHTAKEVGWTGRKPL